MFLRLAECAGELKVGKVGADDEQHDGGNAGDEVREPAHGRRDGGFVERDGAQRAAGVGLRMVGGETRGDGAKALRSLLRQAKGAVVEGRSILIYPEGTRTPIGSSLPYHAGTAALYRQLGVPVVPVALNSGVFWGRRKFIKWPGTIEVEVLQAIPPGLDRETFMATLRERIEGATKRLVEHPQRR